MESNKIEIMDDKLKQHNHRRMVHILVMVLLLYLMMKEMYMER